MQSEINIALLAGGEGKRLWPISNEENPKQFIILPNFGKSTFQLTLTRALDICLPENIIITVNVKHLNKAKEQILNLNLNPYNFQFLVESNNINTGMAIYNICEYLLKQGNDNITYFFPTDQLIPSRNNNFLLNIVKNAQANKITLLGKKADSICNKFGYIFQGECISGNYFRALYFIEKPSNLQIKKLGAHIHKIYCNLGIYLAKPSVLKQEYNKFPSENQFSVDKMITEKSSNINCAAVDIDWLDIGSIDNLYEYCLAHNYAFINCIINKQDVLLFNEQNLEFKLEYEDDKLQIIRKI